MLFIGYFVLFFSRCPDVLIGWPTNASKNVFNKANLIGKKNFWDKRVKAPHQRQYCYQQPSSFYLGWTPAEKYFSNNGLKYLIMFIFDKYIP